MLSFLVVMLTFIILWTYSANDVLKYFLFSKKKDLTFHDNLHELLILFPGKNLKKIYISKCDLLKFLSKMLSVDIMVTV